MSSAKNWDSTEQDESSFGEVDVAETEEHAEHDPGVPEGNTNNTEQGVRNEDASMILSENSAKLTLYCVPKDNTEQGVGVLP